MRPFNLMECYAWKLTENHPMGRDAAPNNTSGGLILSNVSHLIDSNNTQDGDSKNDK